MNGVPKAGGLIAFQHAQAMLPHIANHMGTGCLLLSTAPIYWHHSHRVGRAGSKAKIGDMG